MTAKEARAQYQNRYLNNLMTVLVIFVPATVVFSFAPAFWLLEILLIAGLAYYYFYVMPKRIFAIDCPNCDATVESNTPWVCGFCKKPNENTADFPFLHQCEHCSAPPKGYQCHHCGSPIFLSADRMAVNLATAINSGFVTQPEDPQKTRSAQVESLRHEIVMAELNAALAKLNARRNPDSGKSHLDALKKDYQDFEAQMLGVRQIVEETKQKYKLMYKDDPELLERGNEVLEYWKEQKIRELS